jgi:hypothetical protein
MNREISVPLSELFAIAGTRVALGIGLGLLASTWLTREQRALAGWSLVGLGIVTTIPLARDVLSRKSRSGLSGGATLASLAPR